MAVTRAEKVTELQQIESAIAQTDSAILIEYKGLKVAEVTELRRQVRAARGTYRVVKNTLARRALRGTGFEPLGASFEGMTAVAWAGEDVVGLAKVLTTFAKTTPAPVAAAPSSNHSMRDTGPRGACSRQRWTWPSSCRGQWSAAIPRALHTEGRKQRATSRPPTSHGAAAQVTIQRARAAEGSLAWRRRMTG